MYERDRSDRLTRIANATTNASNSLGFVPTCLFVATIALGPLDSARVLYNNIIGDMPLLKNQVVSYVRDNIRRESGYILHGANLEAKTASVLCTEIGLDGKINSANVSTETMFDAAEDHAESTWQRWIMLSLKDQ